MTVVQNRLVEITPPSGEPITLEEAKNHVVSDGNLDDDLIESKITAARQTIEDFLKQPLLTRTLEYTLDCFPSSLGLICLPWSPVQSITSLKYIDVDGGTQTLASSKYSLLKNEIPAVLVPSYNQIWPLSRKVPESVTIRYEAGYGSRNQIPERIKQAILLTLGQFYLQREEVLPGSLKEAPLTAKNLLSSVRQATI